VSARNLVLCSMFALLTAASCAQLSMLAEGDAARGQQLFESRCTGCHAMNENRGGPKLQGVYGRTSGTAEGFSYSVAIKKAAIVWDERSLDKWLTDPDEFIPGNAMDFSVPKEQERQDLIAFLKKSSAP
jgi:cytochrome c